jgi:hypothetical protein
MMTLRIGQMLYGYCGGEFSNRDFDDKRVEAIGVDWVIVRGNDGIPDFANCNPDYLEKFTKPSEDDIE